MDLAPPPDPAPLSLADLVTTKLADATSPLKFADVKKGLPKPKKTSAAVFDANVREALVAATRAGRAFAYPSGKNGEERYWGRDEKHAIREAALNQAVAPDTLPRLVKAAAAAWKSDAAFADGVIRDLITEERLFEHPPAKPTKGALVRFGTRPAPPPPPPPHPLMLKNAKAPYAAFLKAARTLLGLPGVELDDLFARTRAELVPTESTTPEAGTAAAPESEPAPRRPDEGDLAAVGELILAAIRGKPVASLADVRRSVPAEYRGPVFDAAVLDLGAKHTVALHRDENPLKFTPKERAELVTDGANLYTAVSVRG